MKRREFLYTTTAVLGGSMIISNFGPSEALAEDTPVKGGTLIWGHSETTQNLDIHQTGTASSLRVLQNIHNSLINVDPNLWP